MLGVQKVYNKCLRKTPGEQLQGPLAAESVGCTRETQKVVGFGWHERQGAICISEPGAG